MSIANWKHPRNQFHFLTQNPSISMAPTPWGTGGTCPLPTFTNVWAWGTPWVENSKQETDQTVLTITKALTKTTNCVFKAKKWRGPTEFFFPAPNARSVPPAFSLDRCPLFPPLSNSFQRHSAISHCIKRQSITLQFSSNFGVSEA